MRILLMCKKFLVSMLLTIALAGCGQQSSDKQTGNQTDIASPVQDQIPTPSPADGSNQDQQAGASSAEPTQTPPTPETASPAQPTQPASGTDGSASPSNPDVSSSGTSTPSSSTPDKKGTKSDVVTPPAESE